MYLSPVSAFILYVCVFSPYLCRNSLLQSNSSAAKVSDVCVHKYVFRNIWTRLDIESNLPSRCDQIVSHFVYTDTLLGAYDSTHSCGGSGDGRWRVNRYAML